MGNEAGGTVVDSGGRMHHLVRCEAHLELMDADNVSFGLSGELDF